MDGDVLEEGEGCGGRAGGRSGLQVPVARARGRRGTDRAGGPLPAEGFRRRTEKPRPSTVSGNARLLQPARELPRCVFVIIAKTSVTNC